ncbi:unnamed protein product [Owenia fusiformis]|uniref:Uncharacterized protein n=1 Tax=Owenia fusiformis TaxID=6347 RepID=A0A8J1UFM5_OWEFU|nr:unnamed protein product [Owenia fusiformis]
MTANNQSAPGLFESSKLYSLINQSTKSSILAAIKLCGQLNSDDIKQRSEVDLATYLHLVVSNVPNIWRNNNEDINIVIPLIYRLAVKGVAVNAQNSSGNTALHLSCLKPKAEPLCDHLLRIGIDPCLPNKKGCRVIHSYRGHHCYIVKKQSTARSGLWNAIELEDKELIEQFMQSWYRVQVKRKHKTLIDVADETGNIEILRLLKKYTIRNEIVSAAFACDVDLVTKYLGKIDFDLKDPSFIIPKPLSVALSEVGPVTKDVIAILLNNGIDDGTNYAENVKNAKESFENCDFYRKVQLCDKESLECALELVEKDEVDLFSRSHEESTSGWTFMHLLVSKYLEVDELVVRRMLIRLAYKLALKGLDVNARNAKGDTPLVMAGVLGDQTLSTHMVRMGVDPGRAAPDGQTVNVEIYEDKGKLVKDRRYRRKDLPGLWVAIEDNDVEKTLRWLKSQARVGVKRCDRYLKDVSRDLRHNDVTKLLEKYDHINEFVTACYACNHKGMMAQLSLGSGKEKVNIKDEYFHVGFTEERKSEWVHRPLIVTCMELCDASVVEFLIQYGADLTVQYEECAPCGPVAFWAYRDDIDNSVSLVVANQADPDLRDECGSTMLHKAVIKKQYEGKADIIRVLLDRGINLAARDGDGNTPRDLLDIHDVENRDVLKQLIDDFVLDLVSTNQIYNLENLILEGYEHINDIVHTPKKKNAKPQTGKEIALLKEYKEISQLLDELEEYQEMIANLHKHARKGDLRAVSKTVGEKRASLGKDKGGRSLLHIACMFNHPPLVKFLVEQFPPLLHSRDTYLRTPLHYCVTVSEGDRQENWQTLIAFNGDQNSKEVNGLSVYDYTLLQEEPIETKSKTRGRRVHDFRPDGLCEREKVKIYGELGERYGTYRKLENAIRNDLAVPEVEAMLKHFHGDMTRDDLDIKLLFLCVDCKRTELAKFFISEGYRTHIPMEVLKPVLGEDGEDSEEQQKTITITLLESAKLQDMPELVQLIEGSSANSRAPSVVDTVETDTHAQDDKSEVKSESGIQA